MHLFSIGDSVWFGWDVYGLERDLGLLLGGLSFTGFNQGCKLESVFLKFSKFPV